MSKVSVKNLPYPYLIEAIFDRLNLRLSRKAFPLGYSYMNCDLGIFWYCTLWYCTFWYCTFGTFWHLEIIDKIFALGGIVFLQPCCK